MDFAEYFETKDLSKDHRLGIHYEQKTTPDLLWCASLVILDVTSNDETVSFTDNDIRSSPVFNALMQDYFSKPPQHLAIREYDKVSRYQLGVLAFSGVLEQVGTRPQRFQIRDLNVLEYIAVNDLNASKFLVEYTEKFLLDNGLLDVFETYKNSQTQANYELAKETYWQWARTNTEVRGTNPQHTYRVFNKIFNVYCYKHRVPGEYSSRIEHGPCPYSYLIYNRENFRDTGMPAGMTRQQYTEQILSQIDREGVTATILQKVSESIREKYGGESEIRDQQLGYQLNSGVHVHHILPINSHPQFILTKENLIALTPGQHLSLAHVEGDTRRISPEFQLICLKKKLEHIKESLSLGEDFYNLKEFIKIINTCLSLDVPEDSTVEFVESKLGQV